MTSNSNISGEASFLQSDQRGWHTDAKKVFVNFIVMSLCFAANHATVVTALGYATSALKAYHTEAEVSSGTLYILYTLTALTISSALVQTLKAKWSLFLGLLLYSFYVASFAFAVNYPDTLPGGVYTPTLIGSILGGLAAGWIWTAQGAFFARSAMWYARAKGVPIEEATSFLGGIFATIYVGGELILKFISSPLVKAVGFNGLFGIYAVVAVATAFLMLFVQEPPLDEGEQEKQSKTSVMHKTSLAINLLRRSRKMQCLVLLNMAFGFTGALLNGYCNGALVSKGVLGSDNVGYITSITPGVATLLSIPYSYLANHIGKCPMMVWGACCFSALACTVLFAPLELLRDMGWWISILYVLQGSGRAVFENTNKAMVADFFPDEKEGAFANVIFQSGFAAALGFFVMAPDWKDRTHLKTIYAAPTAVVSLLAGVFIVYAFRIHAREQSGSGLLDEELGGDDDEYDGAFAGYTAPEGGRSSENKKAHGKETWG